MPSPSIATKARLAALMPRAIAEDWNEVRLAKEANCGVTAARTALNSRLEHIVEMVNANESQLLATMQKGAANERPRVLSRLKAAGSAADRLLKLAEIMMIELESEGGEDENDSGDDESEPERPARGRCKITRESRLASLASAVKAASAASRDSWLCFKDASGLTFAERAAELSAKAAGEKTRQILVPDIVVTIDPE